MKLEILRFFSVTTRTNILTYRYARWCFTTAGWRPPASSRIPVVAKRDILGAPEPHENNRTANEFTVKYVRLSFEILTISTAV